MTLVSSPAGARAFAALDFEEWTPLMEMAPEQPLVLTIFIWAWEKGTQGLETQQERDAMRQKIDDGVQSLVSSFVGTDATSLLDFMSHLGNLDAQVSRPSSHEFSFPPIHV